MDAPISSTKEFNRAAEACSNHRMCQLSYEAVYSTPQGYDDPIREEYTFKCVGPCQQVQVQVIKSKP